LVKLCGYLPLAIRIVGSSLRSKINLSAETMIQRLREDKNRLELVESSFWAAFEQLAPEMQVKLLALSVFPGSFEGCAAAAVFALAYEKAEDDLGSMLEYGLIDFDPVTSRYQQNDLLRLFCKKEAAKVDHKELETWETRFLEYFHNLLKQVLAPPQTEDAAEPATINIKALKLLSFEQHNLQSCLKYSLGKKNYFLAWKFAASLQEFLYLQQQNIGGSLQNWNELLNPVLETVEKERKADTQPVQQL